MQRLFLASSAVLVSLVLSMTGLADSLLWAIPTAQAASIPATDDEFVGPFNQSGSGIVGVKVRPAATAGLLESRQWTTMVPGTATVQTTNTGTIDNTFVKS